MDPEYADVSSTMGRAQLRTGSAALGGLARDAAYRDPLASESPPLTAIAMAHVQSTNNQLNEIAARLYELRDRLFGPELTQGAGNDAKMPPASGFADAFSRSVQETSTLLSVIDRLSLQISNRL